MEELNNLISGTFVSSVLNRDVKQFGKKYLFDNNEDTCWNSDQGDHQHIFVTFKRPVSITNISIQFQGGFSSNQCDIYTNKKFLVSIYPEDINVIQKFSLESEIADNIKISFLKLTDFFGRIIIYDLKFYGKFV